MKIRYLYLGSIFPGHPSGIGKHELSPGHELWTEGKPGQRRPSSDGTLDRCNAVAVQTIGTRNIKFFFVSDAKR